MFKKSTIIIISFLVLVAGCGKKNTEAYRILTTQEIDEILANFKILPDIPVTKDEKAVIKTNMGTIELEFFPDVAPNHCVNFKKLANSGYYNGITFHRVIPGFMIQAGNINTRDDDPKNDSYGNFSYTIDAEFNSIHHDRGIVSMARAQDPNSGGAQFFICVSPKYHLDNNYTVFGKVIKGMEVVDKIVAVKRAKNDRPLKNVVIEEAKVIKK